MLNLDFSTCAPSPSTPDFDKYHLIVLLIIVSWLMLFTEPFARRFCSAFMDHYYPDRAEDRTVWLYQNIHAKRTSLNKFFKKKSLQKYAKGEDFKSQTFVEAFRAKFDNFWLCRKLIGYNEEMCCAICGRQQKNE